ncbi:MAG: hypothetical protein NTW08_08605 [Gammaproteobacteria bacterium]|nr:hypothetical protein [Gammaproteobacteria bacterium]
MHNQDDMEKRQQELAELRSKASALQDENNQQVQQIWLIEGQLNDPSCPEGEKEKLVARKERLKHSLDVRQNEPRFRELLDKIKQIELELFGTTKVGGSSPYVL